MTLLVRRRALLFLVAVAVVTAIIPAALGYTAVGRAGGLSPAEAKTAAERLLFVGIVAASFLVLVLFISLARIYRLSTALSRIAELHMVGGYDVGPALRKLGDVGESITRLYGQLSELSARKTTRISAMNALLNVIMARSAQRLLVVDPKGTVFRTTPAALKLLDTTAGAVLSQPVNAVVPGVDFARARAAAGRRAEPWVPEESDIPVAIQPVLNDRGEAAYYLYYLGPDARLVTKLDPGRDQPEEISPQEPALPPTPHPLRKKDGILTRLRRFFGKKTPRSR